MQCKKCGQTAFADLEEYKGEPMCAQCIQKEKERMYDWDNPRLAIQMEIGSSFTDYDTVIVPFKDNAWDYDDLPVEEAFDNLKVEWEDAKWGYHGGCREMELIEVDADEVVNPEATSKCYEFDDLWCYTERMIEPELYNRPFDKNPAGYLFSCYFAYDCFCGNVYSKDFNYTTCESCERTICEQNPSNGWMSQMHFHDGWAECNKCYEERTLRDGINEDWDGQSIPGQFYNYEDIAAAGWEQVKEGMLAGSGYTGYRNPDDAISYIQELIDKGNKVLINYGPMAIGGLGGYIDVYIKKKGETE